jgi:subtilisin family serine protease
MSLACHLYAHPLALPVAAAFLLLLASLVTPVLAGSPRRVTRLDELPRDPVPIDVPVRELLTTESAFDPFAKAVRADVERVLSEYAIDDAATNQRLLGVLANLDLLDGDFAASRERMARARALQTKPGPKLVGGLVAEAYMEAREKAGSDDPERVRPLFREALRTRVESMPWEVVQEDVEQLKGQFDLLTETLLLGMAENQLQPVVDKTGDVSRELAAQIVSYRTFIALLQPLRTDVSDVLGAMIGARRVVKEDIWQARSIELPAAGTHQPVVVAVWDTGVDATVFPDAMWVNPKERMDGRDTDGNDFVDDVHGIAFDLHHRRVPELLFPLEDAAARLAEMEKGIKGYFDLRAALDTPEAAALRARLGSLPPADLKVAMEDLSRYAIYAHGTHVAGIAVAGNPFARILVARLTADYRTIGEVPSIEDAEASVREFQDVVGYFREHGVRVVNMSWIITFRSVEAGLEQHGVGKTPEERAALARRIFAIQRDGLEAAFRSAPGVLFVGGAGNEDNDVSFDQIVPPALDLANLIIAGAVDQAGDPTNFTSFGDRVQVYASGFEVESFVPGGRRMAFSGSSMASPNVANLAAKLIALDPALTPEQVIDLILRGSDRREGKGNVRLINPARSVELLRGT